MQLAALEALAGYWASGYDWGRLAARLNALPQFTTVIDGVEIHFIHVRSPHEDAVLAVGDLLPTETGPERAAAEAFARFRQDGFGCFLEMATRPQTIGYALVDSPVALAGWLLDHDTDSYSKISRAFVDGEPVGNLTRDNILDNITLYWLTGTAASAPVGFTTFPGEIWATPRSWAEAVYPGRSRRMRQFR